MLLHLVWFYKIKMHTNWNLVAFFFVFWFEPLFTWNNGIQSSKRVQKFHANASGKFFGAHTFFPSVSNYPIFKRFNETTIISVKNPILWEQNFSRCSGFLFHTNTELRKICIHSKQKTKQKKNLKACMPSTDSHTRGKRSHLQTTKQSKTKRNEKKRQC